MTKLQDSVLPYASAEARIGYAYTLQLSSSDDPCTGSQGNFPVGWVKKSEFKRISSTPYVLNEICC